MKNLFSIFILTLISFSPTSCTSRTPVVSVGDYSISQKDIECRNAVIKVSFPEDKRELGLQQLIKSYQYAQILKNNNHEITDEKIQQERKRIDQTTLMPEKLQKIKTACVEEKVYLNAFVGPTLADRTIYYDFFIKTPDIHASSFQEAYVWRNRIAVKATLFEAMAKKEKHPLSKSKVSLTRGIESEGIEKDKDRSSFQKQNNNVKSVPIEIQKKMEANKKNQISAEGKKWIDEIIKPLKPGQVSPQIIDQGEVWLVVRYLKPDPKEKDTYLLQSAAFPKRNFSEWLEEEKRKIVVHKFP